LDLILRNARIAGDEDGPAVDIGIEAGRFAATVPAAVAASSARKATTS
jgi:hypothetical protein